MLLRLDPTAATAVMIAIEMPAMRPYSIAVAPCSSVRNFAMTVPHGAPFPAPARQQYERMSPAIFLNDLRII